jgi:hypothetical protein
MRALLETAVALAIEPVTGFATGSTIRRPPTAPFADPSMAAGANAENLKFVKPGIAGTKPSETERTIRKGRHCDS